MIISQNPEIVALADRLYLESKDDDVRLAELLREQPRDVAVEICTSNLTNALQAFIYAFETVPNEDIYDRLLLQSSALLKRGVKFDTVNDRDIIFLFDTAKKDFFIAVAEDQTILKQMNGKNALELAIEYAKTLD